MCRYRERDVGQYFYTASYRKCWVLNKMIRGQPTLREWKARVVRDFNKLNKVQRQALVLGVCWPAVRELCHYRTAREAWENWTRVDDMQWLLRRLGLSKCRGEFENLRSPNLLRKRFPWRTIRAASLKLWPL